MGPVLDEVLLQAYTLRFITNNHILDSRKDFYTSAVYALYMKYWSQVIAMRQLAVVWWFCTLRSWVVSRSIQRGCQDAGRTSQLWLARNPRASHQATCRIDHRCPAPFLPCLFTRYVLVRSAFPIPCNCLNQRFNWLLPGLLLTSHSVAWEFFTQKMILQMHFGNY